MLVTRAGVCCAHDQGGLCSVLHWLLRHGNASCCMVIYLHTAVLSRGLRYWHLKPALGDVQNRRRHCATAMAASPCQWR